MIDEEKSVEFQRGWNAGHEAGYSDGYDDGHIAGYNEGYAEASQRPAAPSEFAEPFGGEG